MIIISISAPVKIISVSEIRRYFKKAQEVIEADGLFTRASREDLGISKRGTPKTGTGHTAHGLGQKLRKNRFFRVP